MAGLLRMRTSTVSLLVGILLFHMYIWVYLFVLYWKYRIQLNFASKFSKEINRYVITANV